MITSEKVARAWLNSITGNRCTRSLPVVRGTDDLDLTKLLNGLVVLDELTEYPTDGPRHEINFYAECWGATQTGKKAWDLVEELAETIWQHVKTNRLAAESVMVDGVPVRVSSIRMQGGNGLMDDDLARRDLIIQLKWTPPQAG